MHAKKPKAGPAAGVLAALDTRTGRLDHLVASFRARGAIAPPLPGVARGCGSGEAVSSGNLSAASDVLAGSLPAAHSQDSEPGLPAAEATSAYAQRSPVQDGSLLARKTSAAAAAPTTASASPCSTAALPACPAVVRPRNRGADRTSSSAARERTGGTWPGAASALNRSWG
jgi:hypothetical protein